MDLLKIGLDQVLMILPATFLFSLISWTQMRAHILISDADPHQFEADPDPCSAKPLMRIRIRLKNQYA